MTEKDQRRIHFLIVAATAAAAVALAFFTVKYVLIWVMPFVLGFIIAAVVQPAARFAQRHWHMPKRAAGLLFALLLVLGIFGIAAVVVARVAMTLTPMVQALPDYISSLSKTITKDAQGISAQAETVSPQLASGILSTVQNAAGGLSQVGSYANKALSAVSSVLSGVPAVLFATAVTILSACFFSMDYEKIRDFLLRQLPRRHGDTLVGLKNFFFKSVGRMIKAYCILMLITFTELAVGLSLLGVQSAIIIAVLIALVDILPVLGTGTVMVPWAVVTLIMGNIPLAVGLAVLYAIIAVVRNVLEPKIVGDRIGLYPLVTLLAIFLGLKFMGVAGMFIFPLTVLLIKYLNDNGKIHLWK